MILFPMRRVAALLSLTCLTLCALPVQAGTRHVTIDTTGLEDLGTFAVEFTVTDGSSTGDGSCQAILSNFQIAGGAMGSPLPPVIGSVTGDLNGGSILTLTDADASASGLADFAQSFTVTGSSSSLSFDLTLNSTSVDDPAPDLFICQILDSSQAAIATTGPTGTELVLGTFTTTNTSAVGYSSTGGSYTPPVVAIVSDAIIAPEPGTMALLALGTLGIGGLAIRSRTRMYRLSSRLASKNYRLRSDR